MASPVSLESLGALEAEASAALSAVTTDAEAEVYRIKYLGKKGLLKGVLKELGSLAPDDRRTIGARANEMSALIEEKFASTPWRAAARSAPQQFFDYSLPGYPFGHGTLHPLMNIREEIVDIFVSMGFDIAEGPEVELDYYNFEALNFQPHHPARDMQDTFYVSEKVLLRTHTSPVQIRIMKERKPPIRSIMPGRVYRNEEVTARHHCFFHQVEGLYVDEGVSLADLKGTLLGFAKRCFGTDTAVRIRPSYFPFTEPSAEVDVRCFKCKGGGCSLCKGTGWLEIGGSGMVHPHVLINCGVDPEKYTGFAFGMGVERIAQLKYSTDDMRLFSENDSRFLRQF